MQEELTYIKSFSDIREERAKQPLEIGSPQILNEFAFLQVMVNTITK